MLRNIFTILIAIIFCSCNSQTKTVTQNQNESIVLDTVTRFHTMTTQLKCKGIPDSVFKMKNLKFLSIIGEDCDVVDIDDKGNKIDKCCGLGKIPSKIGQLTNLEGLYLQLNGLDSLPREILNCSKLKEIDLTDNNISNIDNIVLLKNLEGLYLFGCWLETLPDNIGNLKKLKELGLTGNRLKTGEYEKIKKSLPNCRIIYEP